jgi:hypothetical protein
LAPESFPARGFPSGPESAPAWAFPPAPELDPSFVPGTDSTLGPGQVEGREPQRRRVFLAAAATLVVLVGAGAGAVAFAGRNDDTTPVAEPSSTTLTTEGTQPPVVTLPETTLPTTAPTVEAASASPSPSTAAADPEKQALAELDRISKADRGRVSINGQYVAQLASKNPGIVDPIQTAADGSHTFKASDILREYQDLKAGPGNGAAQIVLLKSTDYGKRQLYHGKPLYVTFAIAGFGGTQSVLNWCARRFPQLSGDELTNSCAVRRLRPAGSV